MRVRSKFEAIVYRMADFMYPPNCAVCGGEVGGYAVCAACRPAPSDLIAGGCGAPGGGPMCGCCGVPLPAASGTRCFTCEAYPPAFDSLRSLWWYRGAVERCLKTYKYRRKRALAEYFAERIAEAAMRDPRRLACAWDTIAIIPSAGPTLERRGFHHLAAIGWRCAWRLALDWQPAALISQSRRPAQAMCSPAERAGNVHGAFSARRCGIAGRRILLLDDVATSGASLEEAAALLKSAGAKRIDGYTLARSPRFSDHRTSAVQSRSRRSASSVE